jgi:drug/metabolite transporter (DMT)-like permease
MMAGRWTRTVALTVVAMVAFAANSVLCRLALGERVIDAASFSTIRLVTGAATLVLLASATRGFGPRRRGGSWISALMLFLYAVPFSFAYTTLSTGTGALILFGSVQATMILAALWSGERPHRLEWLGLVAALAGLVYLVSPGLEAPSLTGSLLMMVAGISWGVYSLRGGGATDPVAATTDNFVRSVPLALLVSALSVFALRTLHVLPGGAIIASVSGALTSGLGYVIWYAALRGLTATSAATVQLSVPVLAAIGGVIFIAEPVSMRLAMSAVLILGGVGLSLAVRARSVDPDRDASAQVDTP